MTAPEHAPGHESGPLPGPTPGRKGRLLPGVLIGALIPALAFGLVMGAGQGDEGSTAFTLGSTVWALLAFTGVLMLGFDRTRRLGLGILIGFSALILVGAGTCTAVVMGGGL